MAQRVTFYIDGFNFYYGLRRTKRNEPQWADYYWIDMVKLCQGFLGEGQEVEKVIYFTASPTLCRPWSLFSSTIPRSASKFTFPHRISAVT